MERKEFFNKRLLYLFSVDLPLPDRSVQSQGDARPANFASHTHLFKNAQAPIYNALSEARVLKALGEPGEEAIGGQVHLLQEWTSYVPGQEFGEIHGRMVIFTHDDEVLESAYTGIFSAGPQWHWLTAAAASNAGDRARSRARLEAKAFISARFDTTSTRYRWLVEHQCVGYGRLKLEAGNPTSATFDVYALNSPSVVTAQPVVASAD
jgi:uncharacterized protein DUF3237